MSEQRGRGRAGGLFSRGHHRLPGQASILPDIIPGSSMALGATARALPNTVCGLCKQDVPTKRSLTCSRFGVLDCCCCTFCYCCLQTVIRRRIELNKRRGVSNPEELLRRSLICPTCEKPSNLTVSCKTFFMTVGEKTSYIIRFRENMMNVNCPFLKNGVPICFCRRRHSTM